MTKTIIAKHVGYRLTGYSACNMWGGGVGLMKMTPTKYFNEVLTPSKIRQAINDGQFGVESIHSAWIRIEEIYHLQDTDTTAYVYVREIGIENNHICDVWDLKFVDVFEDYFYSE